jgi:hypothetical protein
MLFCDHFLCITSHYLTSFSFNVKKEYSQLPTIATTVEVDSNSETGTEFTVVIIMPNSL